MNPLQGALIVAAVSQTRRQREIPLTLVRQLAADITSRLETELDPSSNDPLSENFRFRRALLVDTADEAPLLVDFLVHPIRASSQNPVPRAGTRNLGLRGGVYCS